MPPRPAPDLDARRDQIVRAARRIAESEGWAAVTMRRIAGELGATQPVVYSAFEGRQALVDAVALQGFTAIAESLESVDPTPPARMHAYLDFAQEHPAIYEAMFSMPSELRFGETTHESMTRAFAAIEVAFPGDDGARAEVAWATLHGLATLSSGGRLPARQAEHRLELARQLLTA